jgi:hypothetical protein
LKFFKIKNSKKTRVYFKIFGQNRIQKIEVTHPTKFDEVKIEGKIEKKRKCLVPYKGETLVPYPQAPDITHPRPTFPMPPPSDFDVFHRCATGPVYR